MIENCEKKLNISIKPYIEEIAIAAPPTFARYLNTPRGTPYGYRNERWDGMMPRTMALKDEQREYELSLKKELGIYIKAKPALLSPCAAALTRSCR